MRLTSPRFRDNHNLQLAAQSNPFIKKGAIGEYVRHIQLALDDIGHKMPKSITPATGTVGRSPDGEFGGETKSKVKDYQRELKRKNPDIGVDGIVGEQTMRALDADPRLQSPVTLPPLPGLGGTTDEDGNLLETIITVLDDSRLSRVDFTAMGVSISRGSYLLVRNALQDGKMSARVEAFPFGVHGVYLAQAAPLTTGGSIPANTFMMPFSRSPTVDQKVAIVHEATHAFCDFRRVGQSVPGGPVVQPFTRDQSESLAHIAQATYHRILTGGPQTDSLTSDLTQGLNPIFIWADRLAQEVLARTRPLSDNLLRELHSAARSSRQAQRKNNLTNFDGV